MSQCLNVNNLREIIIFVYQPHLTLKSKGVIISPQIIGFFNFSVGYLKKNPPNNYTYWPIDF